MPDDRRARHGQYLEVVDSATLAVTAIAGRAAKLRRIAATASLSQVVLDLAIGNGQSAEECVVVNASPLSTIAVRPRGTVATEDLIIDDLEVGEADVAGSDKVEDRSPGAAIGKKIATPPAPPIAWLLMKLELDITLVICGLAKKSPSEIAPPPAEPPPKVLAPPCARFDWNVEPSMETFAP